MRVILGAFGLLMMSGATNAQTPAAQPTPAPIPTMAVGDKIFDTKGGEVGTIESVADHTAVVSTGTQKATLPKTTFARWPKGLVIAMTRDELNAAATKAMEESAAANAKAAEERAAALQTALVPGAQTYSFSGRKMLGTVKSIDGDDVTFSAAGGDVRLPRSAFIIGTAGLSLRMTAEQFETAIQGVGAQGSSTPTT